MSATIKAAITALKGRIAAAYSAISAKGGTLPATQDSDNLASAIATIPSGGGFDFSRFSGFAYAFHDYYGEVFSLADLASAQPTTMAHMFDSFLRYDTQSAGGIMDLSPLDTSAVTDMMSLFAYTGYNRSLTFVLGNNFDTSNVTNFSYMFSYAKVPYPLNIDTSKGTDFRLMFSSSNNYTTNYDLYCLNFESVTSSTGVSNVLGAMNNVTDVLYGHSLQEVESGTCVLFKNLKYSCNIRNVPLDYKNMLACAKGVYDLATAGLTTQTFTLRKATFEAMTAQEQATIQTTFTNKGWTLALAN